VSGADVCKGCGFGHDDYGATLTPMCLVYNMSHRAGPKDSSISGGIHDIS